MMTKWSFLLIVCWTKRFRACSQSLNEYSYWHQWHRFSLLDVLIARSVGIWSNVQCSRNLVECSSSGVMSAPPYKTFQFPIEKGIAVIVPAQSRLSLLLMCCVISIVYEVIINYVLAKIVKSFCYHNYIYLYSKLIIVE